MDIISFEEVYYRIISRQLQNLKSEKIGRGTFKGYYLKPGSEAMSYSFDFLSLCYDTDSHVYLSLENPCL